VLFGVTIVYVASVIIHLDRRRRGVSSYTTLQYVIIIHLGPTIIGGYFDYNELIEIIKRCVDSLARRALDRR